MPIHTAHANDGGDDIDYDDHVADNADDEHDDEDECVHRCSSTSASSFQYRQMSITTFFLLPTTA